MKGVISAAAWGTFFSYLQAAASSSISAESGGLEGSSLLAKRERRLETHPFYQHPDVVSPEIKVKEIKADCVRKACVCYKQLYTLRELFKKKTLSQFEVDLLVAQASKLLSFATGYMDKDVSKLPSWKIADAAALILLVVDALYVAGYVLGPRSGVNTWLPALLQLIPRHGVVTVRRKVARTDENLLIVHKVLEAINYYREGHRAPAKVLVPLKQQLLCSSPVMRLRHSGWQPWRDDDRKWQGSN